ncbi:MAG: hemolysin D [Planctomycetaceae bacterium]|nr:hemolysin D [Planctomycetaceae bacterium]
MPTETIEQTKQQIRALVGEIAQLSKSELSDSDYYAAFLQRVVAALAAVGGAVWLVEAGKRPRLAYQINLSDPLLEADSEDAAQHMRVLGNVVQRNEAQLVPPMSGLAENQLGRNPTDYLLVLAPLQGHEGVVGVVEIFQRANAQPATQRGYLRFLVQMCELAAEWVKAQKIRQFSDRHSLWAQADHFSRLVHNQLDLGETCFTAVNEGRRLIGCDRVCVCIKRGRKCNVMAISGQDTIESRSNIVQALNQLATKVAATGEPLWYEGEKEDLPPQIEDALDEYVEESYAKAVAVLPLRRPDPDQQLTRNQAAGKPAENPEDREIIGALIIEQIEIDLPPEVVTPRVDLVYEHTARAVSNALTHDGILLMPLWRMLGRSRVITQARNLPKTLSAAVLVIVLALVLCLVQADFNMKCEGTLQPTAKRDVFANETGEIKVVYKKHGDPVQAAPATELAPEQIETYALLEIENPDLQVQFEDVVGELNQARSQLLAVESSLLGNRRGMTREERSRLAAQMEQLKGQVRSLEEQRELLKQKMDRLVVYSPIAGQVITWDVEGLLLGRPVQAGQVLLTVAKTGVGEAGYVPEAADWELEIEMPERRIGHVLAAQARDEALPVRYILASAPDREHLGKVAAKNDIQSRADVVDREAGPSVRIRVSITKEDLAQMDLRPGMSVTAKVYCGQRAVGYVWLHEVWEWIERKVLF